MPAATLAATQIVNAIASRIPGSNVHTAHEWPFADTELPAWRVRRVPGGDVTPQTLARNTLQRHEIEIGCLGYVRAVDDLDAALDALATPAVAALFAAAPQAPTDALDALISKIEVNLARDVEFGMTTEGEAAVGVVTVPLRVVFFTIASAPQTITLN